jgi:hypothetical protein
MSVVTISNELGSQGSTIAAETAEQLGYHLADQSMLESILKDYGLVEFDEEYRSIPGFWEAGTAGYLPEDAQPDP